MDFRPHQLNIPLRMNRASIPNQTSEPKQTVVLMIGALASVCALVLPSLGLGASLENVMAQYSLDHGNTLRFLPSPLVAGVAIIAAFSTVWMLETAPTLLQKWLLWCSSVIVFSGWIVVAWLWGWLLPPSHLLIAVVWSGICTLIRSHQRPKSEVTSSITDQPAS